jgi:hypothetical protein
VNAVAELTVSQKILMAAYHLTEQGQTPFSAEALIVSSWQEYPRTFGLKGYADQHPDSNRVLSCIMGERGLAHRGWLAKVGQKLYTLSREGRHEVQRLLHGGDEPSVREEPPARAPLGRDREKHLLNLLSSTVVQRFAEGLKNEITFRDACRFWGITETYKGDDLESRLDQVPEVVAEVEGRMDGDTLELSNGRLLSKHELRTLNSIHDYLRERFTRHLTLLRNRTARN